MNGRVCFDRSHVSEEGTFLCSSKGISLTATSPRFSNDTWLLLCDTSIPKKHKLGLRDSELIHTQLAAIHLGLNKLLFGLLSVDMSTSLCFYFHSGGNEESELCELQTAREWSDDEVGGDGDPDDDEGLGSSPSLWGTPRQNSFELTFSYIAIAEAEAVGAARHHRDRRRGGSRASRTPLFRTDTLETLLDSPDVDWDPYVSLRQDQEEEESERGDQERGEERAAAGRREHHGQSETITIQPSPQNLVPETQGRDAEVQRVETPCSQTVHPSSSTPSSQHQSPSHTLQGEKQNV